LTGIDRSGEKGVNISISKILLRRNLISRHWPRFQ